MDAEIDNFPVSQLQERYGIGKQAIYNRLEALSIKPFKEGKHSYVTASDLRSLDRLHNHIQSGGSMADFSSHNKSKSFSQLDKVDVTSGLVEVTELLAVIEACVKASTEAAISAIQPKSPLWYHWELTKVMEAGILLTTAEVKELIGVKPVCQGGQKFYKRGSWTFVKSGKIGSQTAWRVSLKS
ncbi:MAG: hypothetical protein F6K14_26785 [Symploca sp. SIO2C1]|nr:hypothetical protein [Symploca sp. SIO2C1]